MPPSQTGAAATGARPGGSRSPSNAEPGRGPTFLVGAASLVLVIAGLKLGADLVVPLLLALFLAVLTMPLVHALCRRGLPGGLAVGVAILALIGILVFFGLLFSASFGGLADAAPRYEERFSKLIEPALQRLAERGITAPERLAAEALDVERIFSLATSTFAGLASFLELGLLVPLITIFTLLESLGFRTKLQRALGSDTALIGRFRRIATELQHYLVIKTLLGLFKALVAFVLLWILGVDFPLFWALLTFLTHYIPNIGALIATVFPTLLALVQLGPTQAVLTLVGFLLIELGVGNFVEPPLMGRRLGLSPLIVLLSLVFWGWLWGLIGALLSVPLTMVLKMVLESVPSLKWLAVLMESDEAPEAAAATEQPAP